MNGLTWGGASVQRCAKCGQALITGMGGVVTVIGNQWYHTGCTPPSATGTTATTSALKVFLCTDHDGHWPVGVASIVIAYDEPQARGLLQAALDERGLGKGSFSLREIPMGPRAYIVLDGNY